MVQDNCLTGQLDLLYIHSENVFIQRLICQPVPSLSVCQSGSGTAQGAKAHYSLPQRTLKKVLNLI